MVEEEIDKEVALADLDGNLSAEVSKASAELDEKFGDVIRKLVLKIPLVVILGKGEEIEDVGVFESLLGEV